MRVAIRRLVPVRPAPAGGVASCGLRRNDLAATMLRLSPPGPGRQHMATTPEFDRLLALAKTDPDDVGKKWVVGLREFLGRVD